MGEILNIIAVSFLAGCAFTAFFAPVILLVYGLDRLSKRRDRKDTPDA